MPPRIRSLSLSTAVVALLVLAPYAGAQKPDPMAGFFASDPSQPDQAKDDDASKSFLIGRYEPACFLFSPGLCDKRCQRHRKNPCDQPLRFFAARVRVDNVDLTKMDVDQILEKAGRRAARVISANRISLVPIGVVDREQIDLGKEWAILGVACPLCEDVHWTAVGFNGASHRHEIHTNSRDPNLNLHDQALRWTHQPGVGNLMNWLLGVPSNFLDGHWVAPLDEGGWGAVPFANTAHCRCRCEITLRIGLARENGDVTFAFQGPPRSVRMLGDYVDKALTSHGDPNHLYDEQIQYYAVVATGAVPERQVSDFAVGYLRGAGKTLQSPMIMNRYRPTTDKFLILGVENAGRHERKEFVVAFDGQKGEWMIWDPRDGWTLLPAGETWRRTSSGGFEINLRIVRDAAAYKTEGREGTEVGFLFLMPQ